MNQATADIRAHALEDAYRVSIRGEFNAFAENKLMDAYQEAARAGSKAVLLDFRELQYMNSSGIGLLVTLLIRAKRQGVALLAAGLSPHYRQIFELTRLNEAIRVYPTVEEALAALQTA